MKKQEKTLEQRVNNLIGQLEGINSMIREGGECFDVVIQLKAVKAALSSLLDKYVEREIGKCIVTAKESKNERKLRQLLTEVCKK